MQIIFLQSLSYSYMANTYWYRIINKLLNRIGKVDFDILSDIYYFKLRNVTETLANFGLQARTGVPSFCRLKPLVALASLNPAELGRYLTPLVWQTESCQTARYSFSRRKASKRECLHFYKVL